MQFKHLRSRDEKKEEVKKTYDWKKGIKKVEKKPVEESKPQEKVQLKKPKAIEKQKEEPKEGIKLKPIPGKDKPQPEKAEPVKLKPVPAKEKKEEVRLSSCLLFLSIYILMKLKLSILPTTHRILYLSHKIFK